MNDRQGVERIRPVWWAAILCAVVVGFVLLSSALFAGTFVSHVPITLTADRTGLMMDIGNKVKLRGVEVGRVASITAGGPQPARLKLDIDSDKIAYIPANVGAEIKATTVFGTKYVDLLYPASPSAQRLHAGEVLVSRNVSIEVNTVFQDIVKLLDQIDPAKLNAVLSALAEGLRGHGETMGHAITDANRVLQVVNPRSGAISQDWHALERFSDTYSAAAPNILATLNALSTTSTTITSHKKDLDSLLLDLIGLGRSGTDLIAPNEGNLINAINILEPTTNLLMKYNPEYTCLLVGSKWWLDHGGYKTVGGNRRTLVMDAALLFGADPYKYPDNLPVVAAKGGPGGKPGCGSLPDVSKNFPVRELVTNTGWGTGMDIRPNVGLGHPCWVDYFPVTRGIPEPPSVRCQGPPSPGLPIPPPGPTRAPSPPQPSQPPP